MKKLRKIIAILLMLLISIGNTYATWFPDEPMVIYGNVSWASNWVTMKIYDWENNLLKSINISDWKYWTNKTFDIDNKILLNTYNWTLSFKIDWYNFSSTAKWEIAICETETTFQKWSICEYNLSFSEIIVVAPTVAPVVSSWGGGWGGSSSSSSSSSSITTTTTTSYSSNTPNTTEKSTVKRNEDWKIVIKWTDYIKTLKMFNTNKKVEEIILWKKVLTVKWDNLYNKNVEANIKQIHKDIQLDSIRKSMIRHLDRMTVSYWIYTDSELTEELKETYKEKLREDKEYFDLKFKKLIRKDEIIRHTLEKRRLEAENK